MLTAAGMNKFKPPCMETLARQPFIRRGGAVGIVTQKGVADAGHMDADLVGPAGLETAAYTAVTLIAGQNLPMGHGRAGIFFCDSHAFSVCGVPANRVGDRAAVFPETAPGHGLVLPGKASVRKLCGEPLMSKVILGSDQQARGIFIDPVNDTRTFLSADTGERITAMPQQGIYQSAVRMSWGRVYNKPPGLVNYNQILILVDDIKRDVLSNKGRFLKRGEAQHKAVSCGAFVVFPQGCAGHCYTAILKKLLGSASREAFHGTRKESVDTLAALPGCDKNYILIHAVYLNSARMSSSEKSASWPFAGAGAGDGACGAGAAKGAGRAGAGCCTGMGAVGAGAGAEGLTVVAAGRAGVPCVA